MTFAVFDKRIKEAAKLARVEIPPAHGFRIGGTTEWLLRGLPFDVVRTLGRWSSDAFRLYLRKHAEIIAPYIQDRDEAFRQFVRATELPPVR
jgi:hypothetical protein